MENKNYAEQTNEVIDKTEKLIHDAMFMALGSGNSMVGIGDLPDEVLILMKDYIVVMNDLLGLVRSQAELLQETHDMVKELKDEKKN